MDQRQHCRQSAARVRLQPLRDLVFQLLFDRQHNVLMTRYSGTWSEEDIVVRDKAVARFVARQGLARGIFDFSEVTAIGMPLERVVRRAHAPPLLQGQTRVLVASHDLAYGISRIIAAHQFFSRKIEPLVVCSLQEAYRALAVTEPDFEPLENDEATVRDSTAVRVLCRIDEAGHAAEKDERQRLRQKVMRLLDTALISLPADGAFLHPPTPLPQAIITLSDVMNSALRRAAVSDADLTATCVHCRKVTTLAACRILASRETTYACPSCSSTLVVLTPSPREMPTPPPRGYALGDFLVHTEVDIECPGAVLPKS